jgi:pSer/pThr/pTyr-binding forkhead associated (FHA) protein
VVVVVLVESASTSAPLELTFPGDEAIGIGRDRQNGVQLPDPSVSLLHARITPAANGKGHVLIDENSTNGSFVNGTRLTAGASKPLVDGDRIQVGRARLLVRFRTPSTAPPAAFSTQDIALALVQGALIQAGSTVAPRLTVLSGPDQGLQLVLREERTYILGRDEGVDLKLQDDDASRRHTSIVRRGSRLWVIDLGSKNGTLLDGRRLQPNVPEAWPDTAVLELGNTQLGIDDPVSSALRNLERAPDERLTPEWSASRPGLERDLLANTQVVASQELRVRSLSTDSRGGFSTVTEPKGVLSLSTSSSSSAPSAPIEVLQFGKPEPRPAKPRKSWSTLDAMVIAVAVVTIALSALALAWFLAS